jgi:hypothetical protein
LPPPLQRRAIVISQDLGFEELFQRPGQAGAGTVDWHRRLGAVVRGALIRTARYPKAGDRWERMGGLPTRPSSASRVRSASAISNCFAGNRGELLPVGRLLFGNTEIAKRKAVIVIRERNGNTLPAVFRSEGQALSFIKSRIAKGTVVHADESGAWNDLHGRLEMRRINHEEAYSLNGACTNWAETFFSRMRRAEIGHHHHIAGAYLLRYAQEASWREDNRRISNGEQVNRVAALAMVSKRSVDFCGYWQRHIRTIRQ